VENGHPKIRQHGACINPFHYVPHSPAAYVALLQVLCEALNKEILKKKSPTIDSILLQYGEHRSLHLSEGCQLCCNMYM
jgi:hypothetical protein